MKNTVKIFLAVTLLLTIGACAKGSGDNSNIEEDLDGQAFTKNVVVLEFVSFDCRYCPRVHKQLEEVSTKDYPGRIDVISVHGRLEEDDPMEFVGYQQLQEQFYRISGYPAVILDLHDDLTTTGTFDKDSYAFLERINIKSPIGIAVNTALEEGNKVRVDVEVANRGADSRDYHLGIAVLENNITYRQADLVDGNLTWIDQYTHDNVLRAILSDSYFGDPIGNLTSGNVYSKAFTYTVPPEYKKDNLSFVAYVIESKPLTARSSINSRSVSIGKSIGFDGKVN